MRYATSVSHIYTSVTWLVNIYFLIEAVEEFREDVGVRYHQFITTFVVLESQGRGCSFA